LRHAVDAFDAPARAPRVFPTRARAAAPQVSERLARRRVHLVDPDLEVTALQGNAVGDCPGFRRRLDMRLAGLYRRRIGHRLHIVEYGELDVLFLEDVAEDRGGRVRAQPGNCGVKALYNLSSPRSPMITAHTGRNHCWAFCQKVLGGSAAAAGANGAGLVGTDGAKGAGLVGSDMVGIPPLCVLRAILNLFHAERRQKRP
jgi:hypothetical protein